jgi:dephospho-CoA kinase
MKIIGITGNIGCGKSTVCKIFENKYNIPVFYADIVAKDLLANDKNLISKVCDLFGDRVLKEDGTINRRYIFDHVFNNKQTLAAYNIILHPPVISAFYWWCEAKRKENHPYVIEESALIYEAGTAPKFNQIISVNCDLENRIKRASVHSGLTEDEIRLIDSHQMNWIDKMRKSDLNILNVSGIDLLEKYVDFIHTFILNNND